MRKCSKMQVEYKYAQDCESRAQKRVSCAVPHSSISWDCFAFCFALE